MPNIAVVGAQWGDEGKGKVVDLLCDRFDVVARFQGGPNAGHTVAFDGISAPFAPKITSFNLFSTSAAVNQDGEPRSPYGYPRLEELTGREHYFARDQRSFRR